MHLRRLIQLPLLAVVCLAALGGPVHAQFVTRFEVSPAVISPDGDGRQDTTRVRYSLSDTALVVSIVVFEADSVTPVATLRAPSPETSSNQNRDYGWRGLTAGGSPAAEGAYIVTLRATNESGTETVRHLPVFVDVTPPAVQILSVIPNPYAPGLSVARPAAEVSHVVSGTSPVFPGRTPDRLGVTITNPGGAAVDAVIETDPPFNGADGNYVSAWDGSEVGTALPDGEYTVTVTIDDAAGYTARDTYHFDVDTALPTVAITTPAGSGRVRVVPDSLAGVAFDRHGIDSLYVKYPSSAYQPVASTFLRNDSLVFAVSLADSVVSEGAYPFAFRAVDRSGRAARHDYTLTYDLSAPSPPLLDPFTGTWHSQSYRLEGSAGNGGDSGTFLRVTRNGAPLDSLAITASGRFQIDVPLVVGRNTLLAYLRDGAGNLSGPSNAVVVSFQSAAGVFVPVPFAPGDRFQINADRVARSATLRVFDVTGDLVTRFDDDSARQYYSFDWNGRNSSDRNVRRGPLVAVAIIEYDDGTRDVFREVFLFDASPR